MSNAADMASSPTRTTSVDVELEIKSKKASERISENMHIFANDPSLACYRLQEHIQKSLPQLVSRRLEVAQLQRDLQGKCYDLEYSINAAKSMQRSQDTFHNTRELLQKSIALKQQLSQKEGKGMERKKKKKSANSVYQRFSGSFDLPSSLLPSGLSSSASASADLKSVQSSQRPPQVNRRTRASSVSSATPHPAGTRAHSASCSPTPRKTTSTPSASLARGQSVS